jgi:hypothetical protein
VWAGSINHTHVLALANSASFTLCVIFAGVVVAGSTSGLLHPGGNETAVASSNRQTAVGRGKTGSNSSKGASTSRNVPGRVASVSCCCLVCLVSLAVQCTPGISSGMSIDVSRLRV